MYTRYMYTCMYVINSESKNIAKHYQSNPEEKQRTIFAAQIT